MSNTNPESNPNFHSWPDVAAQTNCPVCLWRKECANALHPACFAPREKEIDFEDVWIGGTD